MHEGTWSQAVDASTAVNDQRLKLIVVGRNQDAFVPRRGTFNTLTAVSDAKPYYADADFFVLPTKHDPCSLVVLEALVMGLPVISTKFNGACEIMTDGVHGFVLDDPADVLRLADRMKRLLDPELRTHVGRVSGAASEARV